MSDRPQGENWWLASDGKWYPPESRPAPPPPPVAPTPPAGDISLAQPSSFRRLSGGLSGTLVGFLWAAAAFYLLAAVVYLPFRATWDEWREGTATFAEIVDAENLAIGMGGFAAFLTLVAAVLFIIWHQAYKSVESLGPTGNRWSPGWAVGGWFIPLANLVIPKLVMNEVERISDPTSGPAPVDARWSRTPLSSLGVGWWATWVAGIVVLWIAAGVEAAADSFGNSSYGPSFYLRAVSYALLAVSGALAASFVVMIRRRLSREPRAAV